MLTLRLNYTRLKWVTLLNNIGCIEYESIINDISVGVFGFDINEFVSNEMDRGDFSAALQMSSNYVHQNFWRQGFLNNLDDVGAYPKDCRNIAVSMGTNVKSQGYDPGTTLLDYRNGKTLVDWTLPLPWGLGGFDFDWTPIEVNNTVNAMPGKNDETFNTALQIQPFVNSSIYGPSFSRYHTEHDPLVAPSNCNMDNAPGAYYKLPIGGLSEWLDGYIIIPIHLSHTVCIPTIFFGDICWTTSVSWDKEIPRSDIFGSLTNDTGEDDPVFCFVPTVSALALNNTDWFADLSDIGKYPHNETLTPFDAICMSNDNYIHAWMPPDPDVNDFLVGELHPDHLYIQNRILDEGYTNVFEAQNITIGEDVDTEINRTLVGDVLVDATTRIDYRVPTDGVIIIEEGSDIAGHQILYLDPDYNRPVGKKSIIIEDNNDVVEMQEDIEQEEIVVNKKPEISNFVMTESLTITDIIPNSAAISKEPNERNVEQNIGLKVFPNPAKNQIRVSFVHGNISEHLLVIRDVFGNTIIEKPNFYSGSSINVSNLPKGVYVTEVFISGNKYQEKFLIL
ncbi:T9SS type A sorting domain-containing protein [Lentimicrobium sp. S6]|uniref:T9SS type A sorting domain-containing protein n=1 Tax=Lentimicrobium sp. S6 TaxID=2735872 RepID=UPI001553D25F|nr:T9SS type A sorting domain-containing protein [Lentimicrobium sp. S6]NPD48245.1 T9SS type A sorting domain-containing protein [Lentimicrobium sp. S6]